MNDLRSTLAHQGLIRLRDGRISAASAPVSGAGSASCRGPRGSFVPLLMVVPGSQLLIYAVLWILMPAEEIITYPAPATPHPTV